MKTIIQKIHLEEQHSFACREYKTPHFETDWHKHNEAELILITEGSGTALIGDYIGEYKVGDIFFLSSNMPHWFRKENETMIGSALVIQFLNDFWGSAFLNLPELERINQLLTGNPFALKLHGEHHATIAKGIYELEKAEGISRILLLVQLLGIISKCKESKVITKAFQIKSSIKENNAIEQVFDYSMKHYLEPITLGEVASLVGMSIPTFCRFFKKNIKKSYFDFLKELRVSHACKLLRETEEPILDVCYSSGYNSWAHFSRQFKNVKNSTPNEYRKQYKAA
jgi:AraC-like DNA-binding protein